MRSITTKPHKAPKLFISRTHGFVVLMVEVVNEEIFAGVVVHNPSLYPSIGYYSDDWNFRVFDKFNGKVELTND